MAWAAVVPKGNTERLSYLSDFLKEAQRSSLLRDVMSEPNFKQFESSPAQDSFVLCCATRKADLRGGRLKGKPASSGSRLGKMDSHLLLHPVCWQPFHVSRVRK
jgi:hypothetical protein